jgi:hypothetical protein
MAHAADGFPTVHHGAADFYAWRDDGRWAIINHALLIDVREAAGREASPNGGIIDSQCRDHLTVEDA